MARRYAARNTTSVVGFLSISLVLSSTSPPTFPPGIRSVTPTGTSFGWTGLFLYSVSVSYGLLSVPRAVTSGGVSNPHLQES